MLNPLKILERLRAFTGECHQTVAFGGNARTSWTTIPKSCSSGAFRIHLVAFRMGSGFGWEPSLASLAKSNRCHFPSQTQELGPSK